MEHSTVLVSLDYLRQQCPKLHALFTSADPNLDVDALLAPTDALEGFRAELLELNTLVDGDDELLWNLLLHQAQPGHLLTSLDALSLPRSDGGDQVSRLRVVYCPVAQMVAWRNASALLCVMDKIHEREPVMSSLMDVLRALSEVLKYSGSFKVVSGSETIKIAFDLFELINHLKSTSDAQTQRDLDYIQPYFESLLKYYLLAGLSSPSLSAFLSVHSTSLFMVSGSSVRLFALAIQLYFPKVSRSPSLMTLGPSLVALVKSLYLSFLQPRTVALTVTQIGAFLTLFELANAIPDYEFAPLRLADRIQPGCSRDVVEQAACLVRVAVQILGLLDDLAEQTPGHNIVDLPMLSHRLCMGVRSLLLSLASIPCPGIELLPLISKLCRHACLVISPEVIIETRLTRGSENIVFGIPDIVRLLVLTYPYLQPTRSCHDAFEELLTAPHVLPFVVDSVLRRPELTALAYSTSHDVNIDLIYYTLHLFLGNFPLARIQRELVACNRLIPLLRFCRQAPPPGPGVSIERSIRLVTLHALSTLPTDQARIFETASTEWIMNPIRIAHMTYDSEGLLSREVFFHGVLPVATTYLCPFLYSVRNIFLSRYRLNDLLHIGFEPNIQGFQYFLSVSFACLKNCLDFCRTQRARNFITHPDSLALAFSIVADYALLLKRLCRSYTLGQRITDKRKLQGKRAPAFVSRRLGGVAVDLQWKSLPRDAGVELSRLSRLADQVLQEIRRHQAHQ